MSGSINKVILIGNVGKDPDIRTTQQGKKIANLSVATSESWKDKDGNRQERTEWHRISVMSEPLANIVEKYVRKGAKLYIEGSLQTRKWTDANGVEKYTTEIALSGYNAKLEMLDKPQQQEKQPEPYYKDGIAPASNDLNDEIPFALLLSCASQPLMAMMGYLSGISSIA